MDKRTEMKLAATRKEAKRRAYALRQATKLRSHERDGLGEIRLADKAYRLSGPRSPLAATNPVRPSRTRPETTRAWTQSDPREHVSKRVQWDTKTRTRFEAGVSPKRAKRPERQAPVAGIQAETSTGRTVTLEPARKLPDTVKPPAPIVTPEPRWVTVSEGIKLTPAAKRLVALRDLALNRF